MQTINLNASATNKPNHPFSKKLGKHAEITGWEDPNITFGGHTYKDSYIEFDTDLIRERIENVSVAFGVSKAAKDLMNQAVQFDSVISAMMMMDEESDIVDTNGSDLDFITLRRFLMALSVLLEDEPLPAWGCSTSVATITEIFAV